MNRKIGAFFASCAMLGTAVAAELPPGFTSWKSVIVNACSNSVTKPFSAVSDHPFGKMPGLNPGVRLYKGVNAAGERCFRADANSIAGELVFLNVDGKSNYLLTKDKAYQLKMGTVKDGNFAMLLPVLLNDGFLNIGAMIGKLVDDETVYEVSETEVGGSPAWKIDIKPSTGDAQLAAFGATGEDLKSRREALAAAVPSAVQVTITRDGLMVAGAASYGSDGKTNGMALAFDAVDPDPEYEPGFFDVPTGKIVALNSAEDMRKVLDPEPPSSLGASGVMLTVAIVLGVCVVLLIVVAAVKTCRRKHC